MRWSTRAGIGGGVLATLLASVFLVHSGVLWEERSILVNGLLAASALPLVAAVASRRRTVLIRALLVPIGVFLFWRALVQGMICPGGPLESGGSWGFEYDWLRNAIHFGPPNGVERHRCSAYPNRPLAAVGYLLTTVGLVETAESIGGGTDRSDRRTTRSAADLSAFGRSFSVPFRDLDTSSVRTAAIGVAVGLGLSVVFHVGHVMRWGSEHVLAAVPLSIVAVWGVGAVVAGRRDQYASALLAGLGLVVVGAFAGNHCVELAAVGQSSPGVSLRLLELAVRYDWTTTSQFGRLYCHLEVGLRPSLVGYALVSIGTVLALHGLGTRRSSASNAEDDE